ncbi:MAG: hypothetical protein ACI9S8_003274 [Chlamydiales bacterium]|jgi:hypothetical protein
MVQVADTSNLSKLLHNILSLHKQQLAAVDEYYCRIQGLSSLNYLLQLQTPKIHFVGLSQDDIDYTKLLLELIEISPLHHEFISRIFCRPVENLTVENQYAFLAQDYSQEILESTLSLLSEESRRCFKQFLQPYLPGYVLFGTEGCRRLLPCWPTTENVPFSCQATMGENFLGELEPNTNTFFFGSGWLTEEQTFQHVKAILSGVEKTFSVSGSSAEDWCSIINFHSVTAAHMAIQPDEESLSIFQSSLDEDGGTLHIITENHGIKTLKA